MNGRTALGAAVVLLAVLAGALFLDRAQRLVPVYAAARDLPAGTPLKSGDLMVVRVRLPASALRHYLQPSAKGSALGDKARTAGCSGPPGHRPITRGLAAVLARIGDRGRMARIGGDGP
jgi:hypothetical protein